MILFWRFPLNVKNILKGGLRLKHILEGRGKVIIKVFMHKCQNTKFVCIIKIKNFQF